MNQLIRCRKSKTILVLQDLSKAREVLMDEREGRLISSCLRVRSEQLYDTATGVPLGNCELRFTLLRQRGTHTPNPKLEFRDDLYRIVYKCLALLVICNLKLDGCGDISRGTTERWK